VRELILITVGSWAMRCTFLTVRHGASTGCGWRRWPPDSCECTE